MFGGPPKTTHQRRVALVVIDQSPQRVPFPRQRGDGAPGLARSRPQTASAPRLQAQSRSAVCGEASRHCGLYLTPPEHALVLCCDEKSQIQALERTQPGLPLRQGRQRTQTHDYKRHGTTTLFAALNVLEGKVTGCCAPRHRHPHWLKFLQQVDRQTAGDKTLHLVIDNYCTHKHPKVLAWVERRNQTQQRRHGRACIQPENRS